jgi:hypothetical protein
MNSEKFKNMEQTLDLLEMPNIFITSEQDHWLVIHPEEQNKAMRVYRDERQEIVFEWVNAFAAQHDPDHRPPSCFDYEQAMFAIDYFGIGGAMKVTLTCKPVHWGAGLFNIAPRGLQGLSHNQIVLKEDYLKDGDKAKPIARAWFCNHEVYSDLERLSPKANKIKVGDQLGGEYYTQPIPQPIQEFLKTGQLFVLVVDGKCWDAGSEIDSILYAYNHIECRVQNKVTGWKYRDYKAIARIAPEGITYPHSTREVDLKEILRTAVDEDQKPFREIRDAMTFTELQRTIKAGGLMSLEVKDGIPILLNSSGDTLEEYNRYHNPGIHRYIYQIGLDLAYYTENPELITSAC